MECPFSITQQCNCISLYNYANVMKYSDIIQVWLSLTETIVIILQFGFLTACRLLKSRFHSTCIHTGFILHSVYYLLVCPNDFNLLNYNVDIFSLEHLLLFNHGALTIVCSRNIHVAQLIHVLTYSSCTWPCVRCKQQQDVDLQITQVYWINSEICNLIIQLSMYNNKPKIL